MFKKDDRTRLSRKDLFKDTLRKAAHVWKRITELKLTGRCRNVLRIDCCLVCLLFFSWLTDSEYAAVNCRRRGIQVEVLCRSTCIYGSSLGKLGFIFGRSVF